MSVVVRTPPDTYILNYCTKHLNRSTAAPSPEAWRFPIVEADRPDVGGDAIVASNLVTFIQRSHAGDTRAFTVLGTFAGLNNPLPMRRVLFEGEDTGFRALSVVVGKSQLHTYKIGVDGRYEPDTINPQRTILPTGYVWSRFFTDSFLQPIVLEPWEVRLLYRLVEQIMPFRTDEAENFLQRHYFTMSRDQRKAELPKAFRLDGSVGEVNAIDKMLAREEAHRLTDYRICLKQIDRVLRTQNPLLDPDDMSSEEYNHIYDRIAASKARDGSIPGWDYTAYEDPAYFLYLLRRHVVTAAFGHPRYGGNVGTAGWAYLAETRRFVDPKTGKTLFEWQPALEPPIGSSPHYA